MKRLLYVLMITLLTTSLTGCDKFKKTEEQSTEETTIEGREYVDGQWYSRSEIEWKQMKPEEEIVYTPDYNLREKYEFFIIDLMKQRYIKVKLPGDYQYINNGVTIKSLGGEIKIDMYQGELGSVMEVTDSEIYDKDTKFTKDGGKYVHSIVKEIDDAFTIVAQVGSNSADWSFIRDMIMDISEVKITELSKINYSLTLPEYNNDILQSVFPTNEYATVPTVFNDGFITIVNSAYDLEKNIDCILKWLTAVSDGTDITVYQNKPNNLFYGETLTGYSVAIFKNNDQYMYIAYGRGEEAKTNILRMIKDE